jgi:hypothetical protein
LRRRPPKRIIPTVLLVAIDMGYGHLRPAYALSSVLDSPVLELDRPPLGDRDDARAWAQLRFFHESLSKVSQLPAVGPPVRALFERVTAIPPLYPRRDLAPPTLGARELDRRIDRGLGRGLLDRLQKGAGPLLTTFFGPALIADRAGFEAHCVVTDSDINRVWAPIAPAKSRLRYYAPSRRVVDRLVAYGVPRERVLLTGYPLPLELLGDPELGALKTNLARRLGRLLASAAEGAVANSERDSWAEALGRPIEPQAAAQASVPHLTFAIGGAGAQTGLARRFLPSMKRPLERRQLTLSLVAGTKRPVAAKLAAAIDEAGLSGELERGAVEIVVEDSLPAYLARFNALLARTDALWTKPSEMSFFAALGLPLILAPPVGVHEVYNARWTQEHGAALAPRALETAGEWLLEWLEHGVLARAAFAGYAHLPNKGLFAIRDAFLDGRSRAG